MPFKDYVKLMSKKTYNNNGWILFKVKASKIFAAISLFLSYRYDL